MSFLKIESLRKRFGRLQALDGVNLSLTRHEVYGFVGRNGAGKTTTLAILLGLMLRDGGRITFDGEMIDDDSIAYKRQIGFVPDVPAFPEYLKAREVLEFASAFQGDGTVDRDAVEEALSFVGLRSINRKVGSFSRGMRQRLAIGQALMGSPDLIVMDEPTSALDPIGRREILNLMQKLKKTRTVLYSTHILADAEQICDRVGLIDRGRMILESRMVDIQQKWIQPAFHVVCDDAPALKAFLQGRRFLKTLSVQAGNLSVTLQDGATKYLLRSLSEAPQTIHAVERRAPSLEEVFLEVLDENADTL